MVYVPKKRNETSYMQYIQLKKSLNNHVIFSVFDIKKNFPHFNSQRLSEWQRKKYIKKITKEFFIFSDLEINEKTLFIIANRIYKPSYISLEMALSYYGLIPESVYSITSITTKETKQFNTRVGDFTYRGVKTDLMFGYKLENYKNHKYKIAEIEKTLLDYFYINTHLKTNDDFYELRFNADEFKSKFDSKKFISYLNAYNNKSLARRINKFFKFHNICLPLNK